MDNNLHYTVFLLFMLEVLPLNPRVILTSHEANKQTKGRKKFTRELCVPGRWVQVGNHRTWQRRKCIKRRQSKAEVEEKEFIEKGGLLPSKERGPERNASYDPNYGYEPYWAQGDWVFDPDPYYQDPSVYMCGIRCSKIYTDYGRVCGRNKYYKYKSFPNYCALKNEDCSGIEQWLMLYRGDCFRDPLVNYSNLQVQARTRQIFDDFMKQYSVNLPGADKFLVKNTGRCTDCPDRFQRRKKKRK